MSLRTLPFGERASSGPHFALPVFRHGLGVLTLALSPNLAEQLDLLIFKSLEEAGRLGLTQGLCRSTVAVSGPLAVSGLGRRVGLPASRRPRLLVRRRIGVRAALLLRFARLLLLIALVLRLPALRTVLGASLRRATPPAFLFLRRQLLPEGL